MKHIYTTRLIIGHAFTWLTLNILGNHKVVNLWPKGQLINFQAYVKYSPFTRCSSYNTIGIEQKIYFVDSTPLRKIEFEYPKCKVNSKDASIMCLL